eukprot:2307328-Rhodomonas_salina.1
MATGTIRVGQYRMSGSSIIVLQYCSDAHPCSHLVPLSHQYSAQYGHNGAIALRALYAMSGTERRYARAMRCPVLSKRMVLPGYTSLFTNFGVVIPKPTAASTGTRPVCAYAMSGTEKRMVVPEGAKGKPRKLLSA